MTSDYTNTFSDQKEFISCSKNINSNNYQILKNYKLQDSEYSRFLNESAMGILQKYVYGENDPYFLNLLLEGLRTLNSVYRTKNKLTEFQKNYGSFEKVKNLQKNDKSKI